jgi:hypothetical protein
MPFYRRRKIPKTIRELMKRGVDDPRVVPLPVPDETPGDVTYVLRSSSEASTSFVGKSTVKAAYTITATSTAQYTNAGQGNVAAFAGTSSFNAVGKSRRKGVFSIPAGTGASQRFINTSSTTANRVLMETGDYVLQETGDKILLEGTSQNAVLMESGFYVLKEDGDRITLESGEITPPDSDAIQDVFGLDITDTNGLTITEV